MAKKTNPFWKITCNEAAIICNKSQYKESSFLEKVKLEIHIFSCKLCKKYVRQNTLLTKTCKHEALLCKGHDHQMNVEDKENLKKELEKMDS